MKNLSNMLLLSSLHDLERYIYKMKKKKTLIKIHLNESSISKPIQIRNVDLNK